MTDRIRTLTVILDKDYRDDDVQVIVSAIRMTKGVQDVELGDAVSLDDLTARATYSNDAGMTLMKIVHASVMMNNENWRKVKALVDSWD